MKEKSTFTPSQLIHSLITLIYAATLSVSSVTFAQSTFSPSPKELNSILNPKSTLSSSAEKTEASGESTFQRSKRRESLIAIGTQVASYSDAPELREKEEGSTLGNIWDGPNANSSNSATKSSQGRMKFSQYRFGLRASFLSIGPNAAGLFVNFPFRQVQSSSKDFETGGEFGGSEIGVDAFSRGLALLKISYIDRRSKKLGLLSSHQAIKTALYFENGGQRRVFSDMLIQLGPELEFPLTKEDKRDFATYGNKIGGYALISADISLTRMDSLRLSFESRFTRVDSYKYKGQERGGAGLGVATSRLEYGMNESLWIGGYYEYPYIKPLGREAHFGDTELAGLLGPAAGLTFRAEAF